MNKRKAPSIDMASYGPIKDICPTGYRDCLDDLSTVLYELHTRKVLPKKSRRIKVCVSDIVRGQRIEKIKTYSFGYLCREYAFLKERPFDAEDFKEKKSWKLESLAQQGKKEMSFSGYGQYIHTKRLIKERNIVMALPEEQREAKQKEFEKAHGPVVLRIGI